MHYELKDNGLCEGRPGSHAYDFGNGQFQFHICYRWRIARVRVCAPISCGPEKRVLFGGPYAESKFLLESRVCNACTRLARIILSPRAYLLPGVVDVNFERGSLHAVVLLFE